MNFLTKYNAILDYSNKEVVRDLRKFEVKFMGDKRVELARIVSIQDEKVNKERAYRLPGTRGRYLNTPKIYDSSRLLVVCKFLDVFLEEFNELPPRREVKFMIEVV